MKIFKEKTGNLTLREKLFSRAQETNKILDKSKSVCIELIKCMEMYWIYHEDVSHWIEVASSILHDVDNNSFMRYNIVIPHVLKYNELEDIDSTLAGRIQNNLGRRFIESCKSEIIKSKKYSSLSNINNFIYEDGYYERMIRNLVCVLSGEMIDNIIVKEVKESIYYQLNDLRLPMKVRKRYSKDDMRNIVTRYILYCNGDVDNGSLKEY